MKNEEILTSSADETQKIAENFAFTLSAGDCVALHGDLGSGKTTFTQGLAKGLGISHPITSPTFIIMRSYLLKEKRALFYHVDLYRTQDEADIKGIGLDSILKEKNAIVVIEWPEKMGNMLPLETKHIYFEFMNDSERKIRFENN